MAVVIVVVAAVAGSRKPPAVNMSSGVSGVDVVGGGDGAMDAGEDELRNGKGTDPKTTKPRR